MFQVQSRDKYFFSLLFIFCSFPCGIIVIEHMQVDHISYIDLNKEDYQEHFKFYAQKNTVSSSLNLDSQFQAKEYIKLTENTWNNDLTGNRITVAVIDTGIDATHEVFTNDNTISWAKRIKAFYDDNINGESTHPYDISWHGTWTASILGGNSKNYQGVAPNVRFIILKIFEYQNGEIVSDVEKLKKAINWIVQNKEKYNIRIASMSFGVEYDDSHVDLINEINNAVEQLVNENILVVAAAGNYGGKNSSEGVGSISAPGSAKSVLTVGGIVDDNTMYYLSGKGPTHEGIIKPDVCAPAYEIYGATSSNNGKKYESYSGTSGSTPLVSGLAALMLEKNQNLTALELKNIISLTSFKTHDPLTVRDNVQGWGIVQGYAALDALNSPLNINSTMRIDFTLGPEEKVLCLPIKLNVNHYFFKLEEQETTDAELYLFDSEPDENGCPILLANSISQFYTNSDVKDIGIYSQETQTYFLLIKIVHGTGNSTGTFILSVSLTFNLKLGGIFLLLALNFGAVIYILKSRDIKISEKY
ncbi:MAG: S8 family serine peptidase [Promethearchaeota archaeon]